MKQLHHIGGKMRTWQATIIAIGSLFLFGCSPSLPSEDTVIAQAVQATLTAMPTMTPNTIEVTRVVEVTPEPVEGTTPEAVAVGFVTAQFNGDCDKVLQYFAPDKRSLMATRMSEHFCSPDRVLRYRWQNMEYCEFVTMRVDQVVVRQFVQSQLNVSLVGEFAVMTKVLTPQMVQEVRTTWENVVVESTGNDWFIYSAPSCIGY
jgi:hypothetical protein